MVKQSKVFILGAGCSADCGYPLGSQFVSELKNFLAAVPDDCPTTQQSARITIEQFKSHPDAQTLDQLTAAIDRAHNNLMPAEIIHAKVATVAMFLHKEAEARSTGLDKYENFITQILGGGPSSEGLPKV